jgi:hypothetical protein
MEFLWKFRLATFKTLQMRFFKNDSAKRTYDRLRKLEGAEFIKLDTISGKPLRIWRLEKRGFDFLEEHSLPELKAKRFRPHRCYHDLLASAALVGDWLHQVPPTVKIVSEQEIKSLEIPELSAVFPEKMDHDPDGIWFFPATKKAVALEIELSAKSSKKYEQTCAFYSSSSAFDYVVWIVRSPAHGNQILESSRRYGIPREGVHLFVTLDQFKAELWQSHFRNGQFRGISMAQFLSSVATSGKVSRFEQGITPASSSGHLEITQTHQSPLLDFSFSLRNSATSAPAKTAVF